MTVLALATLVDATKNRNDPICVALPKVAKASEKRNIASQYHHFLPKDVTYAHQPLKSPTEQHHRYIYKKDILMS
jgi:hypothetical protein